MGLKLVVTELVSKFSAFEEPEGSSLFTYVRHWFLS